MDFLYKMSCINKIFIEYLCFRNLLFENICGSFPTMLLNICKIRFLSNSKGKKIITHLHI